ncbi:MAG: class I SAM-dependent methyltransferase [Candidatus Altiarchaeota archaeon]|nr:class I SAM-dependent methyltransferase [Candidatus Altiarchaeota archaeon]
MTFFRLVRNRFKSREDYINFQRFQCRMLFQHLKKNGVDIEGKLMLDVGCGNGGYSVEFIGGEAKVISLDLKKPDLTGHNLNFVQGDALNLPVSNDSFDFVFCSSLIEHLSDQSKLISEVYRVLKKDAYCYLSFPPFYSPVGGHNLKPYHLLPEKISIPLLKKTKKLGCDSLNDYGLYKLTIRGVSKKVRKAGFEIKRISTRFSPINFAGVPLFGDLLTWHVEFILLKG